MTLSCGWRLREQTPCPGPVLLMVDRDCTSPGVSACCSGDAGRVARGRPVPWTAGNLGRSRGLPQIWGGPVGCRKFGRSCGCRNFGRSRGLSEISGGPVDCRKFFERSRGLRGPKRGRPVDCRKIWGGPVDCRKIWGGPVDCRKISESPVGCGLTENGPVDCQFFR